VLLVALKDIDAEFLNQVCDEAWSESKTLEFKRELPGTTDDGKVELCKDICAFANGGGGDLVFGIAEASGAAGKVFPLHSNADGDIRRINQTLDALVEPRIGGLEFMPVAVDDGYVLVVRVPISFDGPHSIRIRAANSRRFVIRAANGVSEMTFDQIRTAFDRTATLAERAEAFIKGRIQSLLVDGPTVHMRGGTLLVTHAVALSSVAGTLVAPIRDMHQRFTDYRSTYWTSIDRMFNVDGLCVTGELGNGDRRGYVQVYRNGIVERVEHCGQFNDNQCRGPIESDSSIRA
jgi:hypothetical protein